MTTPCVPTRLDDVIDEMHETGRAIGADGAEVEISAYAVSRPCARLLEDAAAAVSPEISVEIGLGSGLATLAIARGRLRGGAVAPGSMHAIDPHQSHFHEIGLHAVERAGLGELLTYHRAASHVVLPRLLDAGLRVQLAFVDGMHHLDYVMVDLFHLDLMLDVGGVVAVHDMWMPAIQHCAAYWVTNRGYEPVTVVDGVLVDAPCESAHRGCGDPDRRPPCFRREIEPYVDHHTLLLRKRAEDDRIWDHFADYVG